MKFLIDECVGTSILKWLSQNGHDAISVYDKLRGADDNTVLQKAYKENRILITSDKDFGELIFRLAKPHCGIILLRVFDERPQAKIIALRLLLEKHYTEIENHFVVVTDNSIRIVKPIFC